nr:DNA methylase N 6 adenine specific [Hymenolepis microstoma]
MDFYSSGDYYKCLDFKRPELDLVGAVKSTIGDKVHNLPATKVKVIRGFRGERVPLRCQPTQRNSKFYWFISNSIPTGPGFTTKDLLPLPTSRCLQRKHFGHSTLGVDVLTVLVQKQTVGWFTCIENINRNQFVQREIFLILLVQPANVTLQLDLVGRSSVNCEIARGKLSDRYVTFDRKGVSITYQAQKPVCDDETNKWHCLKFMGEFKGFEWKDKKLNISRSGFIPTGPLGPFNRLKFSNVQIGFGINFIRLRGSQGTTLRGFEIHSKHLCLEAQSAGPKFDWMILDAYMGYAELAGGFRIPTGFGASFSDLDMVDGIQIVSKSGKSVGSVLLQQAIYPESIIDRLSHLNNKNSESMMKYQKPNPCGAPLRASNGGYLAATFTQLCHRSPTVLTVFVADTVSKLKRQSNRLIFINIDAVVGIENRKDPMLVIRLNGRSLAGGFAIRTTELMQIKWEKDKLNFNPPDGKTSFDNLRNPSENSRKAIGGRLTLTISDEGTVANFTFTLGSSARPIISRRLLLSTQIDNGLELIAEVPKSRACDVCYLTVTVDRRSVTSIPHKWPPKNPNPQPVLAPINYGVEPIKKSTGNEPNFIAHRSFTLRWSESNLTDSREDFRNWLARMRSIAALNDVTIIYKNSWPVCPVGHHLLISNPPHCAPCPPGSYGVSYRAVGGARYEILVKEQSWTQPSTTVCVACPKGTYQTEPGRTNCTECSLNYNKVLCQKAEKEEEPSILSRKRSSTSAFNITQSKSQLRETITPGAFGILFLCICILGLLAGVVYFFLESIGFMLVAIAKATRSERLNALKRANRMCKKEIDHLRKIYPDIDFDKIVREEVSKAEIIELREMNPELDWNNVICDSRICWLQKCYPYIHWSRIMLEELPDVIREKYPRIDWDYIIKEYRCEQEIEEIKEVFPNIDWEHLLCETKIEHLRKNIPYLNWDGIVAERRIQKLRETYPNINFDSIVCKAICESEINKLTSQYPHINWMKILAEERIVWLRARHPMINWENIVSEVRISKLRAIYPEINWKNVIRTSICENEIEEIKRRFHCLDWESIVKGVDANSIRMKASEAVRRLTSRFPDVAWEQIISENLSDSYMCKLRKKYPFLDWDAITTAVFHPTLNKSVNFTRPEVYQKFRSLVPYLQDLYPYVDWRYFVEKKYASPYINWDYILKEGDLNLYPSGSVLKSTAIDRLNDKYPHVNWNVFSDVGVEKMFEDHPYIQWNTILDFEDICKGESRASISKEQSQVEESACKKEEAPTEIEQEETSKNRKANESLKEEEEYLLKEYRMRRSLQLGDLSLRLNEDNVIEGGKPRTSIITSNEINELAGNRQNSNFVSIVDYELSSRRLDESEQ